MKARILVLAVAVGCGGGSSAPDEHAVGTYIGGGSYLTGPSSCTYTADAGVFGPDGGSADTGPRFIYAPGRITKQCGDAKTEIVAVQPTAARIEGPTKLKAGAKSDLYFARFATKDRVIDGEVEPAWQLGPDCANVAAFGPVLGAQDTGGRDRTRKLETTAKGTCTLVATLTTGSSLHETFKPQTFKAELRVTIE